MWYRVFIASNIAFFLGIFVFFTGDFLMPGLAPFALPAGAFVAGVSGIVMAVSGGVMIWAPDARA